MLVLTTQVWKMFQFPSNGKVLWDKFSIRGDRWRFPKVSIPFKRESPLGQIYPIQGRMPKFSFNSLQTGKSFGTVEIKIDLLNLEMFQFPSNGKVLLDSNLQLRKAKSYPVSIPFKRESPFGLPPISAQFSRGFVHPKTKRELRGAFFTQKFYPKSRQTLVNIEPNAIF